jgi:hypothetical protein
MRGLRESPWTVAAKQSTQLPQRQPASTLEGLAVGIFTPRKGFGDGKDSQEKTRTLPQVQTIFELLIF